MSKRRFVGLLLITTGIILGLIGLGLWLPENSTPETDSLVRNDIEENTNYTSENKIIINLPAPESIVASPMLVRGKVYGSGDQVKLQLLGSHEQLILEAMTDIQINEKNPQSYKMFQTSLIFNQPAGQRMWLNAQLIANDQVIVEEKIPFVFR